MHWPARLGFLIIAAAGNGTGNDGNPINLDNTMFHFPGQIQPEFAERNYALLRWTIRGHLSLFSNYGPVIGAGGCAWGEQSGAHFRLIWIRSDGNQGWIRSPQWHFAGNATRRWHHCVDGTSLEPNATAGSELKQLRACLTALILWQPCKLLLQAHSGKVTSRRRGKCLQKALLAIQNMFVKSDTCNEGQLAGIGVRGRCLERHTGHMLPANRPLSRPA